jgi:hypothetical protein
MKASISILFAGIFTLFSNVCNAYSNNLYPRISRHFDRGNYEKCIELIDKELTKAREEKELWLHIQKVKCINNLYKRNAQTDYIKTGFNSALRIHANLKGRHSEEANKELQILRNNFLSYSGPYIGLSVSNQKNLMRAAEIAQKIYSDNQMSWFLFQFYSKSEKTETALNILRTAVQNNYELRLKGDTSNFLHGYFQLMQYFINQNSLSYFWTLFRIAKTVYPGNPELCIKASTMLMDMGTTFGFGNKFSQDNMKQILDTLRNLNCYILPLEMFYKKEEFKFHCQVIPNFSEALKSSKDLKKIAPDSFNNEYFKTVFIQNLTGKLQTADSVRFHIWVGMSGYKSSSAIVLASEDCIKKLLSEDRSKDANELCRFLYKQYPRQKEAIDKLSKLVIVYNKKFGEGKENSRGIQGILSAYENSKNTPETKEITIRKILTLNNEMTGIHNFSQCMRISKAALRVFPGEKRLLEDKLRWMKLDFKHNYQALRKHFNAEVNYTTSTEGYVTADYQKKFLQVLNLVRRFAGIYDSCTLSASKNQDCQKAALIMSANGLLTHTPSKYLKFYSAEGASAAGSSNLSLGHNGIYALFGQLKDFGSNNSAVGHRRWILNPSSTCFGHGSVNNAMALGVFNINAENNTYRDPNLFESHIDPVTWPTKDYFPKEWVAARWSFSFVDANFNEVQISMTYNGSKYTFSKNPVENGYGLNTVVWEVGRDFEIGVPITININKVLINNEYRDFQYQVTLF